MQNYKLDIDAIPGERWFPKETSFTEDLNEYWGDWGVSVSYTHLTLPTT